MFIYQIYVEGICSYYIYQIIHILYVEGICSYIRYMWKVYVHISDMYVYVCIFFYLHVTLITNSNYNENIEINIVITTVGRPAHTGLWDMGSFSKSYQNIHYNIVSARCSWHNSLINIIWPLRLRQNYMHVTISFSHGTPRLVYVEGICSYIWYTQQVIRPGLKIMFSLKYTPKTSYFCRQVVNSWVLLLSINETLQTGWELKTYILHVLVPTTTTNYV